MELKKKSDRKIILILGNASIIFSILIISIVTPYIDNELETVKSEYERVSEIQTNLHEAIGKSPYNLLNRINILEISLMKGLVGLFYHIADCNEEPRNELYLGDYFNTSYSDLVENEKTFRLHELKASINPTYLKERSDSLEQKVNNFMKMDISRSQIKKTLLYEQLTKEYKQLLHDQLNINTKHLFDLSDQLEFEKNFKKGTNIIFVLFQIFGLICLGISQIKKEKEQIKN